MWMVYNQPHFAHYESRNSRSHPAKWDGHIAIPEILFFHTLVTFCDPFFLVRDSEGSKILSASIWTRWNIKDTAEDISNFKPQQTECHVCEANPFFRKFSHIWMQICVVDVQGL
jgi:hypothetical protein